MKNTQNKIANLLKLGTFLLGFSLLLGNCENNPEVILQTEKSTDFSKKPEIVTLSLKEFIKDEKFKELKKSYGILQNIAQAKGIEGNLTLTKLLEGIDVSVVNTIKKITSDNYVSYTMLMVEPGDKSNNFSNLVIQEKEGVQRIFTVRYFVNKKEARATQATKEEYSTIEMRSGINSYTEPWGDPDGGDGAGGSGTNSCEEYLTVCNMVNVWIPVPCGCGHLPNGGCTGSTCGEPLYPYYNLETYEECEQVCVYEGYNDQTGGTTSGGGTSGGAGSTSSGTGTTEPTDVVTTPVNPDGSSVAPQMLISQLNITNQNQIDWINDTVNTKKVDAIFIFCAENNWASEAKTFAQQAIEALMSFTTTNYPGLSEGLPYKWWKDDSVIENNSFFNQDPYNVWRGLTKKEKEIFKLYPAAAIILNRNKTIAEQRTILNYGHNGLNDNSDAFRHAFFNALNSRDMGRWLAKKLSDAHESVTPAIWSLEVQMDLFNNNIGHQVGHDFPNDNDIQIGNTIKDKINNGLGRYLNPINYFDPNYRDNPLTPLFGDGNHGISSATTLTPTY